jgi:DNA-binding phage protein
MALKTTLWDPSEYLDSPESIANLEAAFEDGDPALIAAALGDIARHGNDQPRRSHARRS